MRENDLKAGKELKENSVGSDKVVIWIDNETGSSTVLGRDIGEYNLGWNLVECSLDVNGIRELIEAREIEVGKSVRITIRN